MALCLDPYCGLGFALWCLSSVYSGHHTILIPPSGYHQSHIHGNFFRFSFNVVFDIFSIQRLKQILLSGSPQSLSTRFEWWQFALECPDSYLSDDSLLWNSLTRIWVMTICLGILLLVFEWWQFALECPNSYLSDDSLLWNSLTRIWVMTAWLGIS